MLVEAGKEEGVIDVEEKEMIHSIFDFTDTVAKQVMVPRTDMDYAPVDTTLPDLLNVITRSGHSRIPIYDDNVDNILGVVHAKDLLRFLVADQVTNFDASKVMREPYFIPGTKDVGELLAEFQRDNIQLAIVRDEYGGTAGLVTVEDLLEEIVGEIRDEYDQCEEPMIERLSDNVYLINARLRIDDINDELETDIPEDEDYDTIGGFVFHLFGHQPSVGDKLNFEELDLQVVEMDSGRIQKIKLIKNASKQSCEIEG
jgi:putative hemolysin